MKNNLLKFLEKIWKLILVFITTFSTVILASNKQNFVYTFLSNHGYTDTVTQKAILSALIALVVGIIQAFLWLFGKLFLWIISNYFKRLLIDICFKVDGRNKKSITFQPEVDNYVEKKVEVVLRITPAGKLSMFLLKIFDIQVNLFFNPEILDINLENDSEWMGETANAKLDDNQALNLFLLKDYVLGGSKNKPFKRTETIFIIPKRVKSDTTYVDFKINAFLGSKISNIMCEVKLNDLDVTCEGRQ